MCCLVAVAAHGVLLKLSLNDARVRLIATFPTSSSEAEGPLVARATNGLAIHTAGTLSVVTMPTEPCSTCGSSRAPCPDEAASDSKGGRRLNKRLPVRLDAPTR